MTLPESLLDPQRRPDVVRDCVALVDSEVERKSGISGFAIKQGYKVVKKLDHGHMVPKAVNDLLPDFAAALEPMHARFRADGRGTFASFMLGKEPEAADSLLAVTDGKAQHAKNAVLKGIYNQLRPTAKRNLEASVGALAGVIDRYAK